MVFFVKVYNAPSGLTLSTATYTWPPKKDDFIGIIMPECEEGCRILIQILDSNPIGTFKLDGSHLERLLFSNPPTMRITLQIVIRAVDQRTGLFIDKVCFEATPSSLLLLIMFSSNAVQLFNLVPDVGAVDDQAYAQMQQAPAKECDPIINCVASIMFPSSCYNCFHLCHALTTSLFFWFCFENL